MTWLILVLMIWITFKWLFKIRLEVVAGTLVYGLGLVNFRLARGTWHKITGFRQAPVFHKPPPLVPENILDVDRCYPNMTGLQVFLGLNEHKRPIIEDLDRYHTLIAGTTGAGKTTILNGIICQLVQRGSQFFDNWELYILDLKSDETDFLYLWKPICDGYYALDEDGSTSSAISAMTEITRRMNSSQKRILVIVDEVAMLTDMSPDQNMTRDGIASLRRVTAQLRSRGAFICATQRPHFKTLDRNITGNLERKICLRTDDEPTARMILRRNVKLDFNPIELKDGEFVVHRPSKKDIRGRSLMVNLPEDINQAMAGLLQIKGESDIRLRLLLEEINKIKVGDQVPGINKIAPSFKGLHSKHIEAYRRNFANAGIYAPIIRAKSVRGYTLAASHRDAPRILVEYIQAGKWQEDPEPVNMKEEQL